MTNQAWRIYHNDSIAKTELTSSPARVKWAKEQGHRVVELIDKPAAMSTIDSIIEEAIALQKSGALPWSLSVLIDEFEILQKDEWQ